MSQNPCLKKRNDLYVTIIYILCVIHLKHGLNTNFILRGTYWIIIVLGGTLISYCKVDQLFKASLMYTKQMAYDNVAMRQRAEMLLQATDNFGTVFNSFDDPFNIDLVVEQVQMEFPHVALYRVKRRINDVRMALRKSVRQHE